MEKFSDFFEDLTPSKGSWEINQEEFVEEDFDNFFGKLCIWYGIMYISQV